MGGIEPAYSYLCAAMRAGKHVVTANKQLMCAHFEELTSLAKEKGVALRCTAAAGGGIPWLTSLSRASQKSVGQTKAATALPDFSARAISL